MSRPTNIADLRGKAHLPVSQAGGTKTLGQYFQAHRNVFASLLPKHVTPERMMRLAINAVRNNPGLAECSIESVYGGVILCAQLGVEPNTPLGHAYLIPFNNNKRDADGRWYKQKEAQFILGYKGMLLLARQSGEIAGIDVQMVCTNDSFDYEMGLDPKLTFRKAEGPRGDFRCAYIAIRYKDGSSWFDVYSSEDILARRDRSQGYQNAVRRKKNDNPWMTDEPAMIKKTCVRMAMPWLPLSTEQLAMAVAVDNVSEQEQSQALDAVLSGDGEFSVPTAALPAATGSEGAPAGQQVHEGETVSNPPETPEEPVDEPYLPSTVWNRRVKNTETPRFEQLEADQFPVKLGDRWGDANDHWYDENQHAWSREDGGRPSTNMDGTFRARRGAHKPQDTEGSAAGMSGLE